MHARAREQTPFSQGDGLGPRSSNASSRPGQDECGRPGDIAVALEGYAAALPPGAYYATADRAAAARATILPPAATGRDTSRAAVATRLTRSGLLQRREGGRVYVARDPRAGRC